jgi:hypothetical protein
MIDVAINTTMLIASMPEPTGADCRPPKPLRVPGAYAAYYNESRTHRSLNKDAPFHRAIERLGAVISWSVRGGLHHQYCRI